MKILYLGDIMGPLGMEVVRHVLPDLRREQQLDLVIAQAENVTGGKSMSPADMKTLMSYGIDFFTGGNHTPKRDDIKPSLEDNSQPVIGPANMPACPGRGWKYVRSSQGQVLVISLLGETFGNTKPEIDNPLLCMDKILEENKGVKRVATIVDFHGDFSSEKRVIGYYLDGKVSAVVGDHWHVPTADAMVLPNGTAHITDVGMNGAMHSSLGVKMDVIITRWHDGVVNKNELETAGTLQFNAVLLDIDTQTGLAKSITQVQKIIN
jgi:metallophosphoesterase (TIGR00282 family)